MLDAAARVRCSGEVLGLNRSMHRSTRQGSAAAKGHDHNGTADATATWCRAGSAVQYISAGVFQLSTREAGG
jgi:hypothetical protein